MTPEADFYYGSVLVRAARAVSQLPGVWRSQEFPNGGFGVGSHGSVLIKFSTKRLSPWAFTFTGDQVEDLVSCLSKRRVTVCFVCGRDGVAAIKGSEAMRLIGRSKIRGQVSVRVSRRRREQYEISGTGGELGGRVADSDLEKLIVDMLSRDNQINEELSAIQNNDLL